MGPTLDHLGRVDGLRRESWTGARSFQAGARRQQDARGRPGPVVSPEAGRPRAWAVLRGCRASGLRLSDRRGSG
ncbi:hypothetical protein FRAAL6086 [Frankia alni ACN14a]|uniref:Uncharacterized protein n=1 Tax=Frankia alni (strain DSM 45986 / CECT 9034 / ACN14a) TaxID=326424 RepID=Q0RCW4_FRAAA|nr:hypothetical protein FRAAL6086 [Frankia alni ACN14a]